MDILRVGNKVRALREARKWSQEELEGKSGVSRRVIQRLESGKHAPTVNSLNSLAGALGVSLAGLGIADIIVPKAPPSITKSGTLDFTTAAELLQILSQLDPDYQRILLSLIYGDVSHMRGRPNLASLIPKVEAFLKLR